MIAELDSLIQLDEARRHGVMNASARARSLLRLASLVSDDVAVTAAQLFDGVAIHGLTPEDVLATLGEGGAHSRLVVLGSGPDLVTSILGLFVRGRQLAPFDSSVLRLQGVDVDELRDRLGRGPALLPSTWETSTPRERLDGLREALRREVAAAGSDPTAVDHLSMHWDAWATAVRDGRLEARAYGATPAAAVLSDELASDVPRNGNPAHDTLVEVLVATVSRSAAREVIVRAAADGHLTPQESFALWQWWNTGYTAMIAAQNGARWMHFVGSRALTTATIDTRRAFRLSGDVLERLDTMPPSVFALIRYRALLHRTRSERWSSGEALADLGLVLREVTAMRSRRQLQRYTAVRVAVTLAIAALAAVVVSVADGLQGWSFFAAIAAIGAVAAFPLGDVAEIFSRRRRSLRLVVHEVTPG